MVTNNLSIVNKPLRAEIMQPDLEALLKAVNTGRRIGASTLLPQFRQVILAARPQGDLLAKTADFTLRQMARLPARVDSPGAWAIDYGSLRDLVPLLDNERCDLEYCARDLDDRTFQPQTGSAWYLRLRCGTNQTWLKPVAAADFPAFPRVGREQIIERATVTDLLDAAPQQAVKSNERPVEIAGEALRFDVGAWARALKNARQFHKALTLADNAALVLIRNGRNPDQVGPDTGIVGFVTTNYAAFVSAQFAGAARLSEAA